MCVCSMTWGKIFVVKINNVFDCISEGQTNYMIMKITAICSVELLLFFTIYVASFFLQ